MARVFGGGWTRALRRLRGGPGDAVEADEVAAPPSPSVLVDSGTRTWWRPGEARTETLVEAVAARDDARLARRVAALVAGSAPSGTLRPGRVQGTSDPAFVELLGVELLRAGRFDRAYALLAPHCQAAWGSAPAFAAGNAAAARQLAGARIIELRTLESWEDAAHGMVWQGVAELEVEYAIRAGGGTRPLRRTVHLVEVEGRWRTLLYPPAGQVPGEGLGG